MFLAELLWINYVVNLLGKVAAKLAKTRSASERNVPLSLPFRRPEELSVRVATAHSCGKASPNMACTRNPC
jgi:pyruvate/2-oxoglutarate/acetoin dehydrogenase E1 component